MLMSRLQKSGPKISVFPKCYFDQLCAGTMDYLEWIRMAGKLGAEGIEHYDGFFKSLEAEDVLLVKRTVEDVGLASSLFCFSPDFTDPDPRRRRDQVERQKRAIDACSLLGISFCRTLSGQRRPDVSRALGIAWVVEGIDSCLEYAARKGVMLCMENHYKDGNWAYPEFAQDEDVFLEIISRIDSSNFGVQYDPSNAIVGGYDPLLFLEKVKKRVVSMHASDRYLKQGYTIDDLKHADGAIGYADCLLHGVTGKGLNDYDRIFEILGEIDFSGWISVEDGMNGMEELRQSVTFLKEMREKYFP